MERERETSLPTSNTGSLHVNAADSYSHERGRSSSHGGSSERPLESPLLPDEMGGWDAAIENMEGNLRGKEANGGRGGGRGGGGGSGRGDGGGGGGGGGTGQTTFFGAYWNLVKSFLGAASFEFPWAIQQAGLVAGTLTVLGFAVITDITLRIFRSSRALSTKGFDATYLDLGREAWGRPGVVIVSFAIIAMSVGVCASYLVFVGETLSYLLDRRFSTDVCLLLTLPLVILMSWVRSYSKLQWTSLVGTLLVVGSMVAVIVYGTLGAESPAAVAAGTDDFGADALDVYSSGVGGWDGPGVDTEGGENARRLNTQATRGLQDSGFSWNRYPLFVGNTAFLFCIHTVRHVCMCVCVFVCV